MTHGKTIIYALLDPRDLQIRYVGKTRRRLLERLNGHLSYARRTNRARHHSAAWMRDVMADGLRPLPIVLEIVPEDDEDDRERWWIARMRALGRDLTNTTAGGEGLMDPTVGVRTQMSENATRQFADPEQRRSRSERMKALWADPAWREAALARAARGVGSKSYSDAERAAAGARMRALHDDPAFKAAQAAATSEMMKARWQDPEYRAAKSGLMTAEHRDRISRGNVRAWADEARREALAEKTAAARAARTHCVHGHELTEANTYMSAKGAKACRRCTADSAKRRRNATIGRADPAVTHEKRVAANRARWADPDYRARVSAAISLGKRKGRAPGQDARPQPED